ncbi:hypothetical protein [Ktedonobacter robiniae]|uniref:Protein kinase domain-containing protein n=1 Tax=Ktedonobacter robiniae TaxID=2778365 RepID=A0ABQ3UJZ3_9CHLR|nr:hypothetical protein [Ktedonobacter robiniae]GHO53003.1 hypothetical protein KSB_14780 [Ktedonobacter robiniae]
MLFCDHCGGGNETTASACQFCQQPLSRLQLDDEESISASSQGAGQRMITIVPVVPLEPGVLFKGRYQIVEVLGEGGYGSTYKAEDAKLKGMAVAIKMIDLAGLSPSQTHDAIATFEREAFMLRLLSHPGIPHLHFWLSRICRA